MDEPEIMGYLSLYPNNPHKSLMDDLGIELPSSVTNDQQLVHAVLEFQNKDIKIEELLLIFEYYDKDSKGTVEESIFKHIMTMNASMDKKKYD